ncbi:MAG: hypothetical protein U0U67_16145 [Chitinophagales bacterium]
MDDKQYYILLEQYILSSRREDAVKLTMDFYSISYENAMKKVDEYIPSLIKQKQNKSTRSFLIGFVIILFAIGIIANLCISIFGRILFEFIKALMH